jgi:hypothetical protein
MNKSTHQEWTLLVALLQSRFDFALRALNPEIDAAPAPADSTSTEISSSSSSSSASPEISTTEGEEEKQEEQGSSSMLDSLLDMINSLTDTESATEPLETEENKNGESKI